MADYPGAQAAYRAGPPPAEVRLVQDVEALARCGPKLKSLLGPCVAAHLPGPELLSQLKALVDRCDVDCSPALRAALIDFQARQTEERSFALEAQAKDLKGLRNRASIPFYLELIELEPTNTEVQFDLGQVYAALNQEPTFTRTPFDAGPVLGDVK